MPYGIPCHALMVRHSCATALPRQETFTFSLIRADHVSMLLLQLVVYDKDAGTADDFIAQCASARCFGQVLHRTTQHTAGLAEGAAVRPPGRKDEVFQSGCSRCD